MGWEQRGSSLLMVTPEPAVFIAQAAPWSPGTVGANGKPGAVQGEAVQVTVDYSKNAPPLETQLDRYRGKLRGKVVLYGETRPVGEQDKSPVERYSDEELAKLKRSRLARRRAMNAWLKLS